MRSMRQSSVDAGLDCNRIVQAERREHTHSSRMHLRLPRTRRRRDRRTDREGVGMAMGWA